MCASHMLGPTYYQDTGCLTTTAAEETCGEGRKEERGGEGGKRYPGVLVFCQGVPIDLLNLCDWNKCKWR